MNNPFFKATKQFKMYRILSEINFNPHLTQRYLSDLLNIAVSMVNAYLDELEREGFIKRIRITRKNVSYILKPKGKSYKDVLSIAYLNATQKIYDNASDFIISFLAQMQNSGIENLVFYGAGEVADIVLNTYQKSSMSRYIQVHAIIDDDLKKQSDTLHNIPIIALDELEEVPYDAIFISSYTHQNSMEQTLKNHGISIEKIKRIFNA